MATSYRTRAISTIESVPTTTLPEVTSVVQWVQANLRQLTERLNTIGLVQLIELHEEPPKPRVGLLVWADGTDWDPGSGAGLYVYSGSAWLSVDTTP